MFNDLQTTTPDMLARVGRHWGWFLAYGIITLVGGLAALVWPGPTILVLGVLFGLQLVFAGIFRFVGAFATTDATGGTRVLLALLGVLSFIVGLYALRHILVTVVALAVILGIFWIVNGAIEIFTALSHREMAGRGWTAVTGILSVLAGLVMLIYPGPTLLVLAIVLGIWLLVYGAMEIVLAFRLRSMARTLA